MKLNDIYGGNFLKADDLKGKGDQRVTIERVEYDEYDGKKRAVLHFAGKDKVLPLNVTNANMIAEILGTDEMDEWEGHRLCLYVTRVDFQGKRVDAIRVKEATVAAAAARATAKVAPKPEAPPLDADDELTDEDIPFAWVLPLILPALGLIGAGLWM